MAHDTSPNTVKTEAAMLAALVGVVAVMLLMALAGYGMLGAAFRGLLLGLAAFVALLAMLPAGGHAAVPRPEDHAGGHPSPGEPAVESMVESVVETAVETAAEVAVGPEEVVALVAVELAEDEAGAIAAPLAGAADLAAVEEAATGLISERPAAMAAPHAGQADDLKRIKGIGPKLEKALNAAGFWRFDQIAGWSRSELAWVDDEIPGVRGRASRDGWVEQARRLSQSATAEE